VDDMKKNEILALIQLGKKKGITELRMCLFLQISSRRVRAWKKRASLVDKKPGPSKALHALLPEEKKAILAIAQDEKYSDDSHRILTIK